MPGAVLLPAVLVPGVAVATHAWASEDLWLGGGEAAAGLPLPVAGADVWDKENPIPGKPPEFARAANPDSLLIVDAESDRWREVPADLGGPYPYRAPRDRRESAPFIPFSRLPLTGAGEKPTAGRGPRSVGEVEAGGRKLRIVGVRPSSPSPDDPGDGEEGRTTANRTASRRAWRARTGRQS